MKSILVNSFLLPVSWLLITTGGYECLSSIQFSLKWTRGNFKVTRDVKRQEGFQNTPCDSCLQKQPWALKSGCILRLTIHAECPMHLEDFPMDSHACPLKFGSCKLKVTLQNIYF